MYLHAGNNKVLRTVNIIGIFDMDSATVGSDTKKFLRNAEKNGLTELASEELPKSFILYKSGDKGKNSKDFKLLYSQISTSSLISRAKNK